MKRERVIKQKQKTDEQRKENNCSAEENSPEIFMDKIWLLYWIHRVSSLWLMQFAVVKKNVAKRVIFQPI